MNRLKFWLFALIVIGLASAALHVLTAQLGDDGVAATDRQLRGAMARVEAAERSALNELAVLAGVAAQDARLQASLHPSAPEAVSPAVKPPRKAPPLPPLSPTAEQLDSAANQAAAEAVTGALGVAGMAKVERVVLVATRDTLVRKPPADPDVVGFLDEALQHKIRRGYAVVGGKLHAGAAVPVGDRGALAVFVAVDPAWLADKADETGAALVLTAPKAKTLVLGGVENPEIVAKTAPRSVPARSGRLEGVDLTPSWLPLHLPPVGPLLSAQPAGRVLARGLPEVNDGKMVVFVSTRAALEPVVRLEWYAAAGLALALVLAIVFGLLIKPTEVAAALPPILLDAARKIEKGDFSVRAPVLAGKLGTLAAALNKAVDAAQSGAQTPVGSVTSEFFARAPEPAAEDPFAMPSRSGRPAPSPEPEPAPAADDTARLDGANLTGAAFEAAPVASPKPTPAAGPAPAPAPAAAAPAAAASIAAAPAPRPTAAVSAASAPELLAGAARAAPPEGDEEQHWREIFRDFVRTRAECGESAEGLTYEKFRQKLESNKSALVSKYGCKTVRFQVYVKDGKAALKATPVR